MAEYVVKGAEPGETVLHGWTPNGYEEWNWLPVRERIVRCRDCAYFFENATLHDEDCPHFCSLHGIDMAETDGFCKWGERRADG